MADNISINRLTEEIRCLKRELRISTIETHISNIMSLVNNGIITKEDALKDEEFRNFVSIMKSQKKASSDTIKANVRR